MTKFKVGDRVKWRATKLKGVVRFIDEWSKWYDDAPKVHVSWDNHSEGVHHPTNLIKLKPKSKPARVAREWWVNVYDTHASLYATKERADGIALLRRIECVHVREVLEDEKDKK